MRIGYARVSTKDQSRFTTDALKNLEIDKIFDDKVSGVKSGTIA